MQALAKLGSISAIVLGPVYGKMELLGRAVSRGGGCDGCIHTYEPTSHKGLPNWEVTVKNDFSNFHGGEYPRLPWDVHAYDARTHPSKILPTALLAATFGQV